MTDAPSSPSRDSRLTAEAVAGRTFSLTKRGYAEGEVRSFLRLVADDLGAALARERELSARVRDLEEQARRPVLPPSDDDLIRALGEETARVLGQARESAIELRNKAEEHARRVVREAQETARELRTTTQQAVEAKTREAEDSARARAKEIVGEARSVRERVLEDLGERKTALQQQIDELRQGRGRLVETYELVERALAHARRVIETEPSVAPEVPELAEPAESAESGESADTAEPAAPDDPAAGAPAPSASAPEPAPERTPAPTPPAPPTSAPPAPPARSAPPVPPTSAPPAPAAAVVEDIPDVHALFEKLRSEADDDVEPAADAAESVTDSAADSAVDLAGDRADIVGSGAAEAAGERAEPVLPAEPAEPAELDGDEPDAGEPDAAQSARDRRTEALAEVTDDLARRGKRALQDEQNDVLDGLRRQRGKIDLTRVLPAEDEQLARWAHVLQPAVDAAYSLGAASVDGSVGAAPSALLAELSQGAVAPLRDRLASSLESIDVRTPADTELAVAQRLGARYREWRGQLEDVLVDALMVAYARGVYDAVPAGTRLRWIPTHEGKCPDCDDNALEPTVKGGEFPTGQHFPPAHPGCRCLLALDDGS
jgi:DivIVA domain-containing protein